MMIKYIKFGACEITLKIREKTVNKFRSSLFYRTLIEPIRLFFLHLKDSLGHNKRHSIVRDKFQSDLQITISESTPEQKDILNRIAKIEWYHSIDLGHSVVTPGLFDHRSLLPHYLLPESLKGMRVLDVATYDGFWAFEFEKRGATEIVAMDIETWNEIDIPPRIRLGASQEMLETKTGSGFYAAKDILKSKVQRRLMNVYNLSPEWMGKFDFVFCGDLLLHLMNPVKALQNIYSVVSGYAYIIDVFNPEFGNDESNAMLRYVGGTKRMVWWRFGLGSLKKMIRDSGFEKVDLLNTFEFSVQRQNEKYWHAVFKATK